MHVSVWKGALYQGPFLFTKRGNRGGKKLWGKKLGKSKSQKSEKEGEKKKKTHALILQPPVPSFLCGWGLPGLIQQQLYNVFLPFNRLHQHTRVYSLQLQTVAVSNKSVFNCGWRWEGLVFHRRRGERANKKKNNNKKNTGHCRELLKYAWSAWHTFSLIQQSHKQGPQTFQQTPKCGLMRD